MYRTALRSASRPAVAGLRAQALRSAPRRFASTSPADKSRSWKGSALRWALAGGAVYYYSTSSVFAEEPIQAQKFSTAPSSFAESSETPELPTVESIIEERKSQATAKAEKAAADRAKKQDSKDNTDEKTAEATAVAGSPAGLEEEADQQGAFNPETGEINWDCPCLGGMAHGPCGEEFKTAFSCFVYSNEEPKGMECIDKFQGMQECFRQYPEIYGAELAEADDAEDDLAPLEQPSDQQTLREEHQATEKQSLPEDDKLADKQALRAEPNAADATAEQKPEKTEKTEKTAESKPAPTPAAAPETKADAPSTTASHGPKWEDATDANKETAKPKDA
ncbi:hypothetical protein NLG97_g9003 [Lecanicillium saksenae]|uniref:Uncharacterized protein n=1 Tax=Lecanicillium saksenae TaxID=468837 RepID=A0ACC1QL59_9HYPO|nr:hypothetical protein NLG97_g9003 [Lecanicillium saksenae]